MGRRLDALFAIPPGTERAIDGLRALALLWTMAFHSVWIAGLRPEATRAEVLELFTQPAWRPVMRADYAVDVFFVLSGYLLGLGLLRERTRRGAMDVRGFYARRFLRIAPVYYVLIALTALLTRIDLGSLWANVVYVNNYLPLAHEFMPWSWSLALEMQFCAALPLLLLAAGAGGRGPRLVPACVALLLVGVGLRAWAALRHGVTLPVSGHPLVDRAGYMAYFDHVYQPAHTRYGAFLCGLIAADGVHSGWAARGFAARPRTARAAVLAAFALMAVLICIPAGDPTARWPAAAGLAALALFPYAFSAAAALVLIAALGGWVPSVTRFLAAPAFHPVAQLSYATFLSHPLVMFVAYFTVLGKGPLGLGERLGYYVLLVAVSLILATGLHMWVEAPFLHRARRK